MFRSLLVATAALAVSTPAFAGGTFVAKTVEPFEQAQRIVADKGVWRCEGDRCEATLKRSKVSVKGCTKAAKEIGQLASYGAGDNTLAAEDLEACNAAAS